MLFLRNTQNRYRKCYIKCPLIIQVQPLIFFKAYVLIDPELIELTSFGLKFIINS